LEQLSPEEIEANKAAATGLMGKVRGGK